MDLSFRPYPHWVAQQPPVIITLTEGVDGTDVLKHH